MDKEKALKTLYSQRSSKEQLREALAWSLGVETPSSTRKESKEASVFTLCKNAFSVEYRRYAGVPYVFSAKDGVALSGIIKKLEDMNETNVPVTFTAIVQNLPEWYKKNAFAIPVINSKFNEIVASISKANRAGTGNDSAREAVRNAFTRNR